MSEQREVVLTLSPRQFRDLARDLQRLREAGAETNTQAILEAVRREARKNRAGRAKETA